MKKLFTLLVITIGFSMNAQLVGTQLSPTILPGADSGSQPSISISDDGFRVAIGYSREDYNGTDTGVV